MSERIVHLSFPYEVRFIPYRRRLHQWEYLRAKEPIVIRTISAEDAPVSHRIVGTDGETVAEVRIFQGVYWWSLNSAGLPIDPDKFRSWAECGDATALSALDCGIRGAGHMQTPEDDFFARKARVLGSNRREELRRAQDGSKNILFCESTVLGPVFSYSQISN
jgi:hypothetical protein